MSGIAPSVAAVAVKALGDSLCHGSTRIDLEPSATMPRSVSQAGLGVRCRLITEVHRNKLTMCVNKAKAVTDLLFCDN